MDIRKTRAYKYAQNCAVDTSGKTPKYVRKQAEEWLAIANGERAYAHISISQCKRVRRILRLMVHPDLGVNMYVGLEPYALFLIFAAFGTIRPDGARFYKTIVLEIARKNFKTFNSAVIFIVGMLIEPKFSRFFSIAPDYKLSSELRLAARKIIKSSPALIKHFKITRDMITCKATENEYVPLAYSNDRMDGKLANMFLADEAGALDVYPIEAMRSSQITLANKLGIIISTQYPNDNNAFELEIDYAKKILDGLEDNNGVFALLYEPDEDIRKNWQTDDNVIYQANPAAINNDVIFDDLCDKRRMAILYEDKRENFLCKHLNIKYKSLGTEGYIEVDVFQECAETFDPEFWKDRDVYIGLDLSQSDDNTAVAMVTLDGDVIRAMVWDFLPGEKVELKTEKEKVNYKARIKAGDCFAVGEDIIDYGEVERFVMNLPERYGVNIVQLGYDRYNAISSVQKFESAADPIECVEIRQHSSILHPPTKLLFERVYQRKFAYVENRLLEINIANSRCTRDTNLNRYVNKKKSAGKVDMVVALINAIYLLNVNEILDGTGGGFVQMLA
ncbi:MAG: terminase [Ruminococcus sp.]|nr:terminase [Ruminococcus sp.]